MPCSFAISRQSRIAKATPGGWQLPYGITTPPDASPADVLSFVEVGAAQARNLPDIETLVLPFGSGNTAMGVLYGLLTGGDRPGLKRVVLMTIGPDRRTWLEDRLRQLGCDWMQGYLFGRPIAKSEEVKF